MADDLVKRLRELLHGNADRSEILPPDIYNPLREAADRIEALEQEIGWALRVPATGDGAAAESMRVILRRALEAK